MSLLDLDNTDAHDIYEMCAECYIKYVIDGWLSKSLNKYIVKYQGIIGDVDNDMVLINDLKIDYQLGIMYYNYGWISMNHPDYLNDMYVGLILNIDGEVLYVTPENIIKKLINKE